MGEIELIGARLNQARLTANFALQDIADRTKISRRFLKRSSMTTSRHCSSVCIFLGYTRAIARAVSLDEESVLAALREKMQIAWID